MSDWEPLLTPRWCPLRPHPEQLCLINSTGCFKVVPTARRSGKSERAKRALIIKALEESAEGKWLDYRYFAPAPTYGQARAIFWSDLKAMVPKRLLGGRIRESDLTIPLITGAKITVVGLDRAEIIERRSWCGGIIDEIANTKPGIWEANIRPALADRNGWCWLIGVPEGRNMYWDLYQYAISGADPDWDAFHWVSADILPAGEIESARRTLSAEMFEQEYEGSFFCPSFIRPLHLMVTIDFGVIGTRGQHRVHLVTDIAEAQAVVRRALRRRLTAPRRIDVPYRVIACHDPARWLAMMGLQLIDSHLTITTPVLAELINSPHLQAGYQ